MIKLVETRPSSFEEEVEKHVWVDAKVEEYESIVKNSVWEVIPRPANKLVVGSRQIFKVKHAANRSIENYKVRFVAKGFSQVEGINYQETFALLAPRAWYTRIDSYLTGLGFTKSEENANLYQILVEGKLLIIVLYVNDLILTSDEQLIRSCKEDLARKFKMEDMGLMYYVLRLEVWQGDGELFVSQGKCANDIQ
eukprot:PITA_07481